MIVNKNNDTTTNDGDDNDKDNDDNDKKNDANKLEQGCANQGIDDNNSTSNDN